MLITYKNITLKTLYFYIFFNLYIQYWVFKKNKCAVICTGPSAYAYHSSYSCRGLNRCSRTIITVTLSEAKSMGRSSCKICGGYTFSCFVNEEPSNDIKNNKDNKINCDEELKEQKRKYETTIKSFKDTINDIKNKHSSLLNEISKLKKMNYTLNTKFKHPDTLLLLLNDNIILNEELTKLAQDNKVKNDSLAMLISKFNLILDSQDSKWAEINLAQKKLEEQIESSKIFIKNVDSIKQSIIEKENKLELFAKQLDAKANELKNKEIQLKSEEESLILNKIHFKEDLRYSQFIYPERFSVVLSLSPQYRFLNTFSEFASYEISFGIYHRFDIDKTDYGQYNRTNRIGILYTFKTDLTYYNLSYLGYLQSLNAIFELKEYIRFLVGYSVLPSNNYNNHKRIITSGISVLFTRQPLIVGISTTVNFNNRFKYYYTDVGLILSLRFDFLRI